MQLRRRCRQGAKPTRRGQDVLRTLYATPIPGKKKTGKEEEAKAGKGDHCRCAGCPVRFLPELIPSYCTPMEKSYSYRRISDQGGRGARGKRRRRGVCVSPWRRGRGGHGGGSITCPRPPSRRHAVPSCVSPPRLHGSTRPLLFRAVST